MSNLNENKPNIRSILTPLVIASSSILFVTCVMPMCDSVSGFVQSWFNAKVLRMQHDLPKDDETKTQAVGFIVPTEEVENVEED